MRINHNIASLNTYRQLSSNGANTNKSLEKLSSGLRINRAGDDAAGLAISEKMRGQIRGLDQASRNAQDGISMIQTAEGALNETHSILQRMKELATQASNGTNTDSDRAEIQKEMNQLTSEVNRIGNTTEFNTQKLLDGGASTSTAALSSGESVGVAAKAATIQSAVGANSTFDLTATDSAIFIGGLAGVAFQLDDDTTTAGSAANKAAITSYGTGTKNAENLKAVLENLVDNSGLIKLSDLATVNVSDDGTISISTKAVGSSAEIVIAKGDGTGAADTATLAELGLAATTAETDSFKGADGAAAVVTGNTVNLSEITKDNIVGMKFDVAINGGKTKTVTIDQAAITAGSWGGSSPSVTELVDTIQAAIDADSDLNGTVTVGNSGNKLTFTSQVPTDGSTPGVKISGDYAATLLGGITEGSSTVGGTFTAKFQIGANNGQSFQMDIKDMRSQALGISGVNSGASQGAVAGAKFTSIKDVTNGTNNTGAEYALDVSSHDSASAAIKVLDNAIQSVSAQRSQLGAYQNRLEHTISNLGTSSENLTAAESRIRDVDMAKEMMEFTKNNILSQAAQAMLAQANQQPQGVLQLLR